MSVPFFSSMARAATSACSLNALCSVNVPPLRTCKFACVNDSELYYKTTSGSPWRDLSMG